MAKNVFNLILKNEVLIFRVVLGIIFLWFGFLKIINQSAIQGLVKASFPLIANPPYFQMLGIFEVIIGLFLLLGKYLKLILPLLILHLLSTLLIFIKNVNIVFRPYFPILTLEGEFVLKNIVLIAVALIIFAKINTSETKA